VILHQQELSVPLQATWLYNVANSFIFFSLLTLICEETGIKGRWEVNYNLKNISIPAMAVHIVPQIITVIICDSPGHHLIIQIILNVGMTTSIILNFTFRSHSTIQIIPAMAVHIPLDINDPHHPF
jgi:hypothetical protein